MGSLRNKVRGWWQAADQVARERAVETINYELEELTHIFGLLVLGQFLGIPSPPVHITLELFPEMEAELKLMLDKVTTARDPLGDLFSVLGID